MYIYGSTQLNECKRSKSTSIVYSNSFMRVKTLQGTIDVECHRHAGSMTRAGRIGGPNGGGAHEGMKHAHRAQPARQVVEIQVVGKQALGTVGRERTDCSRFYKYTRVSRSVPIVLRAVCK
jgi:hypothetical protein